MKAISYKLNPLVWYGQNTKAISYIQPRQQVKLRKGCVLLKGLPKVDVGQILKWHLEYFSSYEHFSKLKRRTQTWV